MEDREFMGLALAEARAACAAGEIPVGAVLVRDGEVLARTGNRRERDQDPTAHAELLALREGAKKLRNWRLRGCTLYVTLEPCPMCAGALVMSQLDRCVFGAYDEKRGCCGSVYLLTQDPAFSHRVQTAGGYLREEAERQLKAFFENRRSKQS